MRKLIEFQILDVNAVHNGFDYFDLMSSAGSRIAEHISLTTPKSDSIFFVCGYGNNAGDGYVAANILYGEGFDVKIFAVSEPKSKAARRAASNYNKEVYDIYDLTKFSSVSCLVVDCLLGSGIKGEPREPFSSFIKVVNQFKNILSIDVPSGFGTVNAVIPNQTITFHDKKIGMHQENCGEIYLVDIGFSAMVDESTGPGELLLFPDFNRKKHKGQNGKVAVVGGGEYSGAPALSGMGAYRAGVDLVHVFVPETSYNQVSSFAPELIVHNCGGTKIESTIVEILQEKEFESIVVGPGMGKSPDSIAAVQMIIDTFENVVIDADAIFDYDFKENNVLITPHKGELSRLGLSSDKMELMNFSKSNHLTLLVKGEKDFITDGIFFKINSTGHPRMAVGGSGDVLAGICGAFMAKGLTPFESARLASYSIGKAGEECYDAIGSGFLPTDLALFVSKVLKKN